MRPLDLRLLLPRLARGFRSRGASSSASSVLRLDFFGRYHVSGHFDLYARVQNALDHHIIEVIGYKNPGVYAIAGASYKFY